MSEQVIQLKSIFPDLDQGVIAAVLQQKHNNSEQAIEALLSMNSTSATVEDKRKALQDHFNTVLNDVVGMPSNSNARNLAGKQGLHIQNVSWEDNGRSKGSAWGPCISDMTLMVEGRALPVIRYPNFEDLTWDVAMDKIPLVVGNELGENLYTVSLKEYLEHFKMYLSKPQDWTSSKTSLYAPSRDQNVIVSAQACFLPVPKGAESKFNVAIYNYQSYPGNPAVLAIVVSSQGTSAQIVENGSEKLYFNKKGQKASFIGQRLSDNRVERGSSLPSGAPMTKEEKQQNLLMIIQVPLKQTPRNVRYCCSDSLAMPASFCAAPAYKEECQSIRRKRAVDVEDAIIRVGESEGEFREVGNRSIERDERFPVRVTLQYYKSTSNGEVNEEIISGIAEQIRSAQKEAVAIGSLVVGGSTGRTTEHHVQTRVVVTPPLWWPTFWLSYKGTFGQYTEDEAKQKLFAGGRFQNSTLDEAKSQCLSMLGSGSTKAVPVTPVEWQPFGI